MLGSRIKGRAQPAPNAKSRETQIMKRSLLYHFTPFSELPRRRRRDQYVSLRWKIKGDISFYGGKFTSDVVLDEPGRPRLYNQWIDCLFLGNDGMTIWNATIITATQEFWDETSSLAWERTSSFLTEEQQEQEYGLKWEEPFENGQKYFRMAERAAAAGLWVFWRTDEAGV